MTKNKLLQTKKIYKEILDVINKYKDFIKFDIRELERIKQKHLFQLELLEKYGIKVPFDNIYNLDYIKIDEYRSIGYYGGKYRRTISWSDDGKQPIDELLFEIHFSAGAYIFGDDYPTELFNKMWVELKQYKPKYLDTVNKCLYFSMDKAKGIFYDFPKILEKYYQINEKDIVKRKKEKLEKELKEIREELEIYGQKPTNPNN